MSTTIPIERVRAGGPDTPDWWVRVVVFDDPTFPLVEVLRAFVDVLEVTEKRAMHLALEIEEHGQHPVWEGTREGADYTARRLSDRGLRACVE